MNCQLTEEQKRKIDENRKLALARRTQKAAGSVPSSNSNVSKGVTVPQRHIEQQTTRKTAPLSFSTAHKKSEEQCITSTKAPPSCSKSITVHPSTGSSKWLSKDGSQRNTLMKKEQFYGSQESVLKGKCVLISVDRFAVEIGYHTSLIEFFKQLETRSYDTSSRTWSFSLGEYEKLMKGAVVFQPSVQIEGLPKVILQTFRNSKLDDGVLEANLSEVDEKLVQSLLSFQKEGVCFGINHNGRILLADDMGLGKTLQALCIASYYRNEWPLLIIAPSSVRYDWARQTCHWLPSVDPQEVNVIDSGKVNITRCSVTIISYDLLSKKSIDIEQQQFRVMIMDESHCLKNNKAVRTKAALKIVKSAKRVILLSGTPALSRPAELFPQILCICPSIFKFHDFGVRYCNAKQQPWGWDYSGSSNMAELQLLLGKKIMIRRQKKDVLSQLPTKTRQVVFLSPGSLTSNNHLNKTYKIMNGRRLNGVERHGVLLQYFHETCKVKLSAVRDYILDLLEAEKKFLVFAHHQEMLDNIEEAVKLKEKISYIRIDGRTPSEQRSFFCRKFQKSTDYKVAILSITAANAGLNLAAASLVIFAELFWNPGILVQAEDRVHRIGQENAVSIQYLIAQKTADDFIWPLVQDKLSVLGKAGLTRDNFSEVDTTQAVDKNQKKILDMFSEEFRESSDIVKPDVETLPEELDNGFSLKKASPSAKSSPSSRKRRVIHRTSSNSSSDSPSKKQMSITSFFPSTSPSKVARPSDSTNQSMNDLSRRLFVGTSNEELKDQTIADSMTTMWADDDDDDLSLQDTVPQGTNKNSILLSQEDLNIMAEVDWDEEF